MCMRVSHAHNHVTNTPLSHVTHMDKWWISHVTHENASCHTCESWHVAYTNARPTCRWVMLHIWMNDTYGLIINESCHTCEWVVLHMWTRHVTHTTAWQKRRRAMSHAQMNNAWVTSCMWMRRVTHMNAARHTSYNDGAASMCHGHAVINTPAPWHTLECDTTHLCAHVHQSV